MNKLGFLPPTTERKNGFTLAEMLIVVAIIAVLAAISISMAHGQLEKARNATDAYNAKVIARSVQLYALSNPEKAEAFIEKYGADPGAYRPYILVTGSTLAISTDKTGFLRAALDDSGLLGTEIRPDRFDGIFCKTTQNWTSYSVAFTVLDGEIVVGYCGMKDDRLLARRWTVWSSPDPTSFRSLCNPE